MTRLTAVLLAGLACASPAVAGDTPETILIRQLLRSEMSAYRRGDADRALAGYADGYGEMRADRSHYWSIPVGDSDALAAANERLASVRMEAQRQVLHVLAREGYAFATTSDSGQVVQRESGRASPLDIHRLWFLRKIEDTWLVTAQIAGYRDSASIGESDGGSHHDAIQATLQDEAQAMSARDNRAVVSLYDENFMGVDGRLVTTPATWKITFSGREEFDAWLSARFRFGSYSVERTVLHAATDASEQQAAALTVDDISYRHDGGSVPHRKRRYVAWLLRRSGTTWHITHAILDFGKPSPP